jgi:hypothetical protein
VHILHISLSNIIYTTRDCEKQLKNAKDRLEVQGKESAEIQEQTDTFGDKEKELAGELEEIEAQLGEDQVG